ncbi:hypothetical protein HGA88_00275 [Candidatus Roizmanbacteria bacterium]|nr:hypothetical protein [Candidatus Roizmanbacteria bacterium]
MNYSKSVVSLLSISLIVGALLTIPASTFAQHTIDLTVSPPSQEFELKGGDVKDIQIKFINRSDEPLSGVIRKADFLVLDKEGTPTLIDQTVANNRFAASTWMTFNTNTVTIPPKSQTIINATIKVPTNAYACGRYTSVYFEPTTPTLGGKQIKRESNASIAFRLASLISIKIPGECKEDASIIKTIIPRFLEYGPISVSYDILNRSDYHITPEASVSIVNLFNQKVDEKTLAKHNIFPDALRTYATEIGEKWMIGQYKVELNATYGHGKKLSNVATVLVFPWKVAAVAGLSLVTLFIILKSIFDKFAKKTVSLEQEIEKEKSEIEKLKEELKHRDE